jgi:hypothetical protein
MQGFGDLGLDNFGQQTVIPPCIAFLSGIFKLQSPETPPDGLCGGTHDSSKLTNQTLPKPLSKAGRKSHVQFRYCGKTIQQE